MFNVLPFGISTAAYVFTKVLRCLVKHWRRQGFKVIMYLDDGLAGSFNKISAENLMTNVRKDLLDSGFLIAEDKCVWQPTQKIEWLGHIFDTTTGYIHITNKRMTKLLNYVHSCIYDITCGQFYIQVRKLASIVGMIQSMRGAVGSLVLLRTKYAHMLIDTRISWESLVKVNVNVLDELVFWHSNLANLNGQLFTYTYSCTKIVYSDASDFGFGGYVEQMPGQEYSGYWSAVEAAKSSTWRELEAVRRLLLLFAKGLEGHTVKWMVDNVNVTIILCNGSMKENLQKIALQVNKVCTHYRIILVPEWIPRELNKIADQLSKFSIYKDLDNWEISPQMFIYFNQIWGPFTVDRFATTFNSKCSRFNSKLWCPGTEAVNTFKVNWAGECNWLVPPPKLVMKTLKKLQYDQAMGVLVVPMWTSAPYWPMLFPSGNLCGIEFIKSYVIFDTCIYGNIKQTAKNNCPFTGSNNVKFIALYIDFSSHVQCTDDNITFV